MSLVKNVARLAGQVRQQSTSQAVKHTIKYEPLCPKFKAKQQLFQVDNDLPVHLKGGFNDMILYRLSWILTIAGTGWGLGHIVKTAYKEFQ